MVGYLAPTDERGIQSRLDLLVDSGHQIVIANQSVYEFWSVATRPRSSNGLDLDPTEAAAAVAQLRHDFLLLQDPLDLLDRWLSLCQRFEVRGRPSHDARLIALADAHKVTHFFTLDAGFYRRFTHMTIVTP